MVKPAVTAIVKSWRAKMRQQWEADERSRQKMLRKVGRKKGVCTHQGDEDECIIRTKPTADKDSSIQPRTNGEDGER